MTEQKFTLTFETKPKTEAVIITVSAPDGDSLKGEIEVQAMKLEEKCGRMFYCASVARGKQNADIK